MGGRTMKTKTSITITLDTEDVEIIQTFCKATGLTVSGLFQTYVGAMTRTIRATGWDKRKSHSKLDLIRFLGKGLMQET